MAKYAYHRSDANAEGLYAFLEAHGVSVARTGTPTDAIAGYWGHSALVEVKTLKGKLRTSQRAFLAGFRGMWAILRTEDDCTELLKHMRAPHRAMPARLHDLGPADWPKGHPA